MTDVVFEPIEILRRLHAAGVRFVVIGGIAAGFHGAQWTTQDLDVCYARDDANLEALAKLLGELHATLRGAPPDVPLRLDARTLRAGDAFTFTTDLGAFDIVGSPAGGFDYESLRAGSVPYDIGDVEVRLASVDDLIAMKRAAGRPRDLMGLEILGALRGELDQRR
jgi:hypothetical protein